MDEFHTGGREATKEIDCTAQVGPDMRILDVGCGIGGTVALLRGQYRCHATGIDLTPDYIRTAESLARSGRLEGRVTYRPARALNIPFERAAFDGAT